MQRRDFLKGMTAAGLLTSCAPALAARCEASARRHLLIAFSWGTGDLGGIGIVPGLLNLVRKADPDMQATVITMQTRGSESFEFLKGYLPRFLPGCRHGFPGLPALSGGIRFGRRFGGGRAARELPLVTRNHEFPPLTDALHRRAVAPRGDHADRGHGHHPAGEDEPQPDESGTRALFHETYLSPGRRPPIPGNCTLMTG